MAEHVGEEARRLGGVGLGAGIGLRGSGGEEDDEELRRRGGSSEVVAG